MVCLILSQSLMLTCFLASAYAKKYEFHLHILQSSCSFCDTLQHHNPLKNPV